jgi:hypothetical protein
MSFYQTLLDERNAATVLGLNPRTLAAWRHRGCGPPYVKISARCIRYRLVDLAVWADKRVQSSTAEDR